MEFQGVQRAGTVRYLIWKSKNPPKIMSITIPENNFKAFCTKRITDNPDFAVSGRHWLRSLRAVSANTGGWICLYECQNTFTLQKLLSTFNAPVLGSLAVRDNIQPIRASLAVRFTCQEISRMYDSFALGRSLKLLSIRHSLVFARFTITQRLR